MAPNPKSLEYEEEDLFGSDEDATLQSTVLTSIASAKPVASISAASSSLASSSRQQRAAAKDAEKRLAELRGRKRGLADESKGVGRGVSTLKSYCLTGEVNPLAGLYPAEAWIGSRPSELCAGMGYRGYGIPPYPYLP